tara:strand:- start:62 stop:478 length:417 start_codon:yes stop_codon:yes gene_type:complete
MYWENLSGSDWGFIIIVALIGFALLSDDNIPVIIIGAIFAYFINGADIYEKLTTKPKPKYNFNAKPYNPLPSTYNPLNHIPSYKTYTPPIYNYRIGAICNDGWESYATGSGACSWHEGVAYWIMNDGSIEYPDNYYFP